GGSHRHSIRRSADKPARHRFHASALCKTLPRLPRPTSGRPERGSGSWPDGKGGNAETYFISASDLADMMAYYDPPCQQETFIYDMSPSFVKGWTMTLEDVEKEWADRARRFLKAELKRAEVSYAELARRLNAKGFQETEASITSKLGRG